MLPGDLDDEQRTNIAHEHPIDVDSDPSSPSSGKPSILHTQHRPKSASRHRSRTPADGSSSHFLARLIAQDEEVREVNARLFVTSERLEAESTRANAAERRALDYFNRLRIATESRERAEQESARLREELRLYKLQLENAQKEIFRAQDIINQVSAQRNEAEAEAARARTKARKLQEEKLVMLAREEGRRLGYREGLSIGRKLGYDEGRGRRIAGGPSDRFHTHVFPLEEDDIDDIVREDDDDAPVPEVRRDQRPPPVTLRPSPSARQHSMRAESAPPERTYDAAPHAPPLPVPTPAIVTPVRARTPSREFRAPSPPQEADEPETIHPIPIRPSPIIPSHPLNVPPPDGWIPRADSRTSYIPVPPPHELQQPVPSSPSSTTTELHGTRPTHPPEPSSLPPLRSRDYAYPQPEPVPVPVPVPRARTPSVVSRTSTHLSQYDLVNKRPGSSLRHEIYAGRSRSGSQPSRASTSRNEHRDQEHRHSTSSSKTEAESIVEQWRADPDVVSTATPSKNPPRSFTPSAPPRQRYPANYYYRPRDIVTPLPVGDVGARSYTPTPMESTAAQQRISEEETAAMRARTPLDHLRQRFRQRPGSNSSIPNIIVESPSEPETNLSPSGTVAAQPELLSPEAANRPLPQAADDQQHQQHQPQPPPTRQQYHQSPYDHSQHSTSNPWPVGFVPQAQGRTARPEKEHHTAASNIYENPHGHARSESASRAGERYEASPIPPGITYPAPPGRPQTSHRRRKDSLKDAEGYRDKDRRREPERGYERQRERGWDREDDGLFERAESPAPLQRPISLFDEE